MELVLAAAGVGRSRVPVADFAEASRKYQQWRDENDLGGSHLLPGSGNIMEGRRKVAHVSYNGKVWPPESWTPDQEPIMEAQS